MASSLRSANAAVKAAPQNTGWNLAVAASAALAIAAGYWAFHPSAAERASRPSTAAAVAAVEKPPRAAESVGSREAPKPAECDPAQTAPGASIEKPSTSDSPTPSPGTPDNAAESEAQRAPRPGETVSIKVNVDPPTAIVFHGSRRISEGSTTVEVTVGEPIKLVILHRGYDYKRIKIDGSEPEVSVRLRKYVLDGATSKKRRAKP